MVVVETAEAGQKNFTLIGFIVAIRVRVHKQVRCAGNDRFIPDYRNAERGCQQRILHIYLRRFGPAIAIFVFQDHHPVTLLLVAEALGRFCIEIAVIDRLCDPHPAFGIDIHVGRVIKHGRFGP
ncbi:hypothetical protein D3C87_1801290 [compost metagenome]